MILDNHRAHHAKKIVSLAHEYGIQLLYLPATASEYNPAELVWANFKRLWRNFLYDNNINVEAENAEHYIERTMELLNETPSKYIGLSFYQTLLSHKPTQYTHIVKVSDDHEGDLVDDIGPESILEDKQELDF